MIKRFSLSYSKDKLIDEYGKLVFLSTHQINYNIAPLDGASIIINNDTPYVRSAIWGLLPHWSKRGINSGSLHNALSEGIFSKPSFRIPIRQHRCLIPADGFYIWAKDGTPYRVTKRDGSIMFFGGIYDVWKTSTNEEVYSFAIVTTPSNRDIYDYQKTMPFILTNEGCSQWLSDLSVQETELIMLPFDNYELQVYRITPKINDPTFNHAELHLKIREEKTLFD